MKALILTGRFGNGHYAAARALQGELARFDVQAEVIDVVGRLLRNEGERLYRAYGRFVAGGGGGVFNWLYCQTEQARWQGILPFARRLTAEVAQLMAEKGADFLFSTYSAASMAASLYKAQSGDRVPLVTCLTDFVPHANWVNPYTDLYLAASPYSGQLLLKQGVSARKIVLSGMPVRREYYHLPRRKSREERRLLVMGGGCGLLPEDMAFYAALDALPRTRALVMTGRNTALRQRLNGRFAQVAAVAFTEQVPQMMGESDVVLTKAGGLSVFEAIAAEKPLILFPPVLEQEKRNAAYLQQEAMAVVLPAEKRHQVGALRLALRDELHLQRMLSNMRRFKAQLDHEGLKRFIRGHIREAL